MKGDVCNITLYHFSQKLMWYNIIYKSDIPHISSQINYILEYMR